MRIKRRNGLVSALLGLVTCGLYHIFFWYQYGEDTNWVCRDDRKMTQNYIVAWILSWITCGIYGLYWTYQLASRLDQAGDRYNVHIESPVIFTIVMHIPFLSYFYACDVMNNFADAYEKTAPHQTESQRDYYYYTGNTTAQTPPPVWPTSGSNPNGTSVNPNGFDFKSTMEDVGNNLKDKAKELFGENHPSNSSQNQQPVRTAGTCPQNLNPEQSTVKNADIRWKNKENIQCNKNPGNGESRLPGFLCISFIYSFPSKQ